MIYRKQAFWFLVVLIGLCESRLDVSNPGCVKECRDKVFINFKLNCWLIINISYNNR